MTEGQFRIRDLELVVALHEEGNMTQAAKRLGMSEPALSKQLKKIERRIQTPLFERGNGGVVTTGSGRSFVAHAAESVQAFRRAVHEAQESKHNALHRLRIGVSTCHPLNLIEMLRTVEMRLYKNLVVEIVTAYSFELMADLQHHDLDLVIVTSPPSSALITSLCFATNPFMIVVRQGHPLAGKASLRLHELGPYPWVFFNRNWSLLTGLIILRVERPDIYADIARLPELLIALQRVYSGAWRLDTDADFVRDFGDKASYVQERCVTYYQPASPLAPIFGLDYGEERERLHQYVSVVTGS